MLSIYFFKGVTALGFICLLLLITECKPYVIPQQRTNINPNNPEREGRLSLADHHHSYNLHEPHGPGTYAFGYDVEDHHTGNTQFREEERHPNGTVTGTYGYVEPDGNIHIVHYVADEKGYRVKIENSKKRSLQFPPATAQSDQIKRTPIGRPGEAIRARPLKTTQKTVQGIESQSNIIARQPSVFRSAVPANDLEPPSFDSVLSGQESVRSSVFQPQVAMSDPLYLVPTQPRAANPQFFHDSPQVLTHLPSYYNSRKNDVIYRVNSLPALQFYK